MTTHNDTAPAAYADRAPTVTHLGHGIWSEGMGWATADLTPGGPATSRDPKYGRFHANMGDALGYIAGALKLQATTVPSIVSLREQAFAGDLAARAVLADACERAGLVELAAVLRRGL